jgi:hypothetical protein
MVLEEDFCLVKRFHVLIFYGFQMYGKRFVRFVCPECFSSEPKFLQYTVDRLRPLFHSRASS